MWASTMICIGIGLPVAWGSCLVSGRQLPPQDRAETAAAETKSALSKGDLSALKADLSAALQSLIQEREWPGATLAVALADGRSFQLAAGLEDIEAGKPLPQNARMMAGSTGKMFVSAVALQLVQEGKLGLDEPIAGYVGGEPWFSLLPGGDEIRLRHLLNHTSGLPRYVFQPAFIQSLTRTPQRTWTVAERLKLISDVEPLHPVGEGWGYSDTNYIVLGAIIEKVTGTTFYDLAELRIIGPLKLRATEPAEQAHLPSLAQGHFGPNNPFGLEGKSVVDGRYVMNPQFEWCGGGFLTSSGDLARLAVAIHHGGLVSRPLHEQLVRAVGFQDGAESESGYGLGTFVWQTAAGPFYGHAGIMPGYLTQVEYSRDGKFAIALQCNTDHDSGQYHHQHVQQFAALVSRFQDAAGE